MLKGKKTYITAAVAIITAVASYLVGDATPIQAAQLVFTALMGAFLRNGVANA